MKAAATSVGFASWFPGTSGGYTAKGIRCRKTSAAPGRAPFRTRSGCVDAYYVGPADMSLSMGLPGETKHPKVKEVENTVRQAALARGRYYLGDDVIAGVRATNMFLDGAKLFFEANREAFIVSYSRCTTGKVSHSQRDHTWSVRPAAMAGVCGSHWPSGPC